MTRRYHVAVLECDTLFEPVLNERGNWANIFAAQLQSSLLSLGYLGKDIDLEVTSWDVVDAQAYPNLLDVDCVFLSGGKHNAYDNEPWILKLVNFVSNVHNLTSIPLIGVCFGHQLIARALGGTVGINPQGWEISATQINLTEEGARLFGANSLNMLHLHHDMVIAPPPDVRNIGWSEHCGVQICHKPGRLLTTQFHPEFDTSMMHHVLDNFRGIFADEASYLDAKARAEMHCDGALVFTTFWKFLLGIRVGEDTIRAAL